MPDPATYAIRKPVAIIVFMGALGVLGLNAALVIQNRTLKREIAAPPALLPQVGTRIDKLEGVALDGTKIQVPFADQSQQTLLFVFSTRCGVCDLNWPQWQSIARSIQGKPYRLVYANIESPLSKEHAKQYGIENATVFAELDPRYEAALNLRLTPLTILLDKNGVAVRVWAGLLQGVQLSDLRRILGTASL